MLDEMKQELFGFQAQEEEKQGSPPRRAMTGRLQIVMPGQSFQRLEAIKEVTEAASYSEVIRRALRIYEGLLAEIERGGEVFVKRPGGTVELVPLKRAL